MAGIQGELTRDQLINQLQFKLGHQLVDVELDPEHYNMAIDFAMDRFRQRSEGSTEESFIFITLQPEKQEYKLPNEVQDVRRMYRRGVGANTTGGTTFDPFEAAFSNIYLLQAGRTGGLATWEFFHQFQENLGRIFGSAINFIWDHPTRTLTIIRRMEAEEDVAVHVYNQKPEITLLNDTYCRPWIRDYALAEAKLMLAEGRGKYPAGVPGPGGNVVLNHEALKQEAINEKERLEIEAMNFNTGNEGMPFIIA